MEPGLGRILDYITLDFLPIAQIPGVNIGGFQETLRSLLLALQCSGLVPMLTATALAIPYLFTRDQYSPHLTAMICCGCSSLSSLVVGANGNETENINAISTTKIEG